jgi:hypothetical protein
MPTARKLCPSEKTKPLSLISFSQIQVFLSEYWDRNDHTYGSSALMHLAVQSEEPSS